MKKAFKRVLLALGIFLLLLIATAVALPFAFKDRIVALAKSEAEANIKGKLDFGDFDLTLFRSFPDFMLTIEDVKLSGIDRFKNDTLFSSKTLGLTLDLMTVLKGEQYRVKEILLQDPRIHLIVLEDGTANWDLALDDSSTTSESTSYNVQLDHLRIDNGFLVYDDRQADLFCSIEEFDHTTNGNFNESLYNVNTKTTSPRLNYVQSGLPYLKDVDTDLIAEIEINLPESKYTFKENEIRLNQLYLGFDGFVAMPHEDIDMDLKFAAKKTDFKNLLSLIPAVYQKDFAKVQTTGSLAFNGWAKGRMTEVAMPGYGITLKVDDASFRYPDMPSDVKNIEIDLQVENPDGHEDHLLIDLKRLYMEMASNPFEARMKVSQTASDPRVEGAVKGTINLSTIKEIIPSEQGESLNGILKSDLSLNGRLSSIEKKNYEQFQLSGTVSLSDFDYLDAESSERMAIQKMVLSFNPRQVDLQSFNGSIGKSDLQATGKIDNLLNYLLKDELLTGSFDLSSQMIDLNQFASDDTATSTTEGESGVIEVPSNIDFQLAAKTGTLLYEDFELKNVLVNLLVRNSRATIHSLQADAMGGLIKMTGFYDTKNVETPLTEFNFEVAGLDIRQTAEQFNTIKVIAPIIEYASGKYSARFSLMGSLNEQMDFLWGSLTGSGKMTTSEAIIRGFKAVEEVSKRLKLESLSPLKLQDINPSFKIINGRVEVSPFTVKMGKILGEVSGSNGLDQTIDYLWKLSIPSGDLGSQATGALNDLANKSGLGKIENTENIPVNVRITGTITDPKVEISMKEFAAGVKDQVKDQVEEKVEEKIEEVKETVTEKARAEAAKILSEAKVQADRIKAEAAAAAERTRKEGYAAADKIEAEATNPVAKVAAKKAADKLRKETDEKAKLIVDEGNRKANQLLQDAEKRSNQLLQ